MTQEHADYLEELRQSGVTNMWGATPYIQMRFDVDEKTADKILFEWIKSKRAQAKEAVK
jgi:hypothetical protein